MINNEAASERWSWLHSRIVELIDSGRAEVVESLLAAHSELRSDEKLLIDCIYAEFCLREERGQTPRPEDYLRRFPDYGQMLRSLFEVHEALDNGSMLQVMSVPTGSDRDASQLAKFRVSGSSHSSAVKNDRQLHADSTPEGSPVSSDRSQLIPLTSPSLLHRLQQKSDPQVWEQFVELYSPLLYAITRKWNLSDADASDLIQDVFVHLLKKLPQFTYDPDKGRFHGWLRTVLLNKLRDSHRREQPTLIGDLDEMPHASEEPSIEFSGQEFQRYVLQQAMMIMQKNFEPVTWKACWETAFCGRTASEVAVLLGVSVDTVYTARSRVLRRLRQEMAGMLD